MKNSFFANLLVSLVAIVICLSILEFSLRILGMADPILYESSPYYGYAPQPNQSADRIGVPIFINDMGLRDNENLSDFIGQDIILVLGDSVTYGGTRIKQRDLFTEVLERQLRNHNPKIKVLNAGVNGYSVTQMLERGKKLLKVIDSKYCLIYAIGSNFSRPPIRKLNDNNIVFPTKKPKWATSDFLYLSINHLNARYNFLGIFPEGIKKAMLWAPPPYLTPEFDKSKITETHLKALNNFSKTVWKGSGKDKKNLFLFLAPDRQAVVENHSYQNISLLTSLKTLDLTFYDIQVDFYTNIIEEKKEVERFFWDQVHYIEEGHALAGNILSKYLSEMKLD